MSQPKKPTPIDFHGLPPLYIYRQAVQILYEAHSGQPYPDLEGFTDLRQICVLPQRGARFALAQLEVDKQERPEVEKQGQLAERFFYEDWTEDKKSGKQTGTRVDFNNEDEQQALRNLATVFRQVASAEAWHKLGPYYIEMGSGSRTPAAFGEYQWKAMSRYTMWQAMFDESTQLQTFARNLSRLSLIEPNQDPVRLVVSDRQTLSQRATLWQSQFNWAPKKTTEWSTPIVDIEVYFLASKVDELAKELGGRSYAPREGSWLEAVIKRFRETHTTPENLTLEKAPLLLERGRMKVEPFTPPGETRKRCLLQWCDDTGTPQQKEISWKTFENTIAAIRNGKIPIS